jgi:hypothetical protein
VAGRLGRVPRDALRRARHADQSAAAIYVALAALPDADLYRRFEDEGVTDLICAPGMVARATQSWDYRSSVEAKIAAAEEFATSIIAKMD